MRGGKRVCRREGKGKDFHYLRKETKRKLDDRGKWEEEGKRERKRGGREKERGEREREGER